MHTRHTTHTMSQQTTYTASSEVIMLQGVTNQILTALLKDFTGVPYESDYSYSRVLATMKRIVHDLAIKHQYLYLECIRKLTPEMCVCGDVLRQIAVQTFSDGISWPRIMSLLSFYAVMCKHLITDKMHDSSIVTVVAQEIVVYLTNHHHKWFISNNSWAGVVDYFNPGPTVDENVGLCNILIILAMCIHVIYTINL